MKIYSIGYFMLKREEADQYFLTANQRTKKLQNDTESLPPSCPYPAPLQTDANHKESKHQIKTIEINRTLKNKVKNEPSPWRLKSFKSTSQSS